MRIMYSTSVEEEWIIAICDDIKGREDNKKLKS